MVQGAIPMLAVARLVVVRLALSWNLLGVHDVLAHPVEQPLVEVSQEVEERERAYLESTVCLLPQCSVAPDSSPSGAETVETEQPVGAEPEEQEQQEKMGGEKGQDWTPSKGERTPSKDEREEQFEREGEQRGLEHCVKPRVDILPLIQPRAG